MKLDLKAALRAGLPRFAVGTILLSSLSGIGWWMSASHATAESAVAETPPVRHEGTRLLVSESSPLRQTLVTEVVSTQDVSLPIPLPAVVEADPARLVKVLPPITGRIVSLNKRLGDEVRQGDVLLTIDSADLAQAMSDAEKAEAALTLARKNIERQRELGKEAIAATRDIEQAQSDFEQAASEQARAAARLAQLGAKGALPRAGHLLSVRSPIAGRVVDLGAAVGGYWNDVNASIMTVADLSTVFITASAQEKDIAQLHVGQAASVLFDAFPGEPLAASVRYVGEMLDPATRTVKARMLVDNRDARLRPGMFATATLRTRAHSAVVIPLTAVVQSGFYSRAFVEVAPGEFEARVLELGAQLNRMIEVISGIAAGERVVIKNAGLLND
ncbi:efflux RND transporter periplasmic adaptor subunit [Rhodocyclus gracilis]|nr:efflux RND transporter periplasmic adaptor subunit [Rhodocyclus gracilis]